ncbi:MAG: CAP domain-containing protein [Thermoleophilia bacterium]
MKRLFLCVLLATFAAIVAAPVTPAQALTLTKPEKKVLALVNHVRATHGLHKLKVVTTLERASRAHSREMVKLGYFAHSSFSGEAFGARLIRYGYTTAGCTRWTVGEDIACGYSSGGTAKAIFKAWMKSKAHRAVILTKRFRNVGVGRAKGTFKGIPGVVFFTLDCGVRNY